MGLSPTLLTGPEAAAGAAPASLSPRGGSLGCHHFCTDPVWWWGCPGPVVARLGMRDSGGAGNTERLPRQRCWLCWSQSGGGRAGRREGGKGGPISLAGTQTSVGSGRSCYGHLKGSLQGHHGRRAPAPGARVTGAGALPTHCRVIILLIPAQQHRGSPGPCLAALCCASLTDMPLWNPCTMDPAPLYATAAYQ